MHKDWAVLAVMNSCSFRFQRYFKNTAKLRKIIDEIVVTEEGSDYINRNVVVDAQNYPPTNKKDLFNIFSGINIVENSIYARNHGFKSGEVLEYSTTGSIISGLSTTFTYKVNVSIFLTNKRQSPSNAKVCLCSPTNYTFSECFKNSMCLCEY